MRDETYGESAVSRQLRWAYRLILAVCSLLPQSGKERTDTHALSGTFILFSVDLAEAEAHRVVLMFGLRVSRCGFLLRRWT